MPDLHLWRLAIDPARLAAIARAQRIPVGDEDHGYTVHALLKGLFDTGSPKPWYFDSRRRILWAYNPVPLAPPDLVDPLYHSAVCWDQSASKRLPILAAGRALAFDLRACPVIRRGTGEGKSDKAFEVDCLVWKARQDGCAPGELDPRQVYAAWLRERAWPAGAGASLDAAEVTGWSKPMEKGANAWRGRGDGRLRLPDVAFTGRITVTDSEAFAIWLARGVGRHRAFGYGMLRIRPA